MKRLSYILLAAMLVAALAVSCTAEVIDDMGLVSVDFEGVRDNGSKGLTVAQAALDVYDSSISWTYKAYKDVGDNTPATGTQTEDNVQLPGGISSGKLTLSQGVWNFELFGYVNGVLVYQGKAMDQSINGKNATVQIKVSPQKNGENGTLVFAEGIVVTDGLGNSFNANKAYVKGIDVEYSGSVNLSSASSLVLKSGSYNVGICCEGDGFTYAEANAVVTIYDGLESVISGTLDENTAEAGFGVIKVDAAAGTTSQSQAVDSAKTKYEFGFSPANSDDAKTVVEVVDGAFVPDAGAENNTVDLVVYNKDAAEKKFVISDGSGMVFAGLDLSLNGASFAENTKVKVSTYIKAGLPGTPKVVYNGNPSETFDVTYDSKTGLLEFETSHFSEYYVVFEGLVAYNETSDEYYSSLRSAVASVKHEEAASIIILSDLTVSGSDLIFDESKDISIHLNGRTIRFDKCGIVIEKAKVRLEGKGKIARNGTLVSLIWLYGSSDVEETEYSTLYVGKDVVLAGSYVISVNSKPINEMAITCGVIVDFEGSIECEYCGFYVNGTVSKAEKNNPVINISNSTVIAEKSGSNGIYAAGYAVWNIANSTFSAVDAAVEIRAGEMNVNGGSFFASTTPTTVTPNGNGSTSSGVALAIAQHNTKLPISVTISDGVFEGFSALYESDPQKKNPENVMINVEGGVFNAVNGGSVAVYSEDCTGFITGGTFNSNPSKYVAAGYVAIEDENIYSVRKLAEGEKTVADYKTLKEAVKEDGTIIITNDITLAETIEIKDGKTVEINLNGNSITKDSIPFKIGNAKVVFSGEGTIAETKSDQYAPIQVYGSNDDTENYTVVTVGKDITLKGWSGIFVACNAEGKYNHYGLVVNVNGSIVAPAEESHVNGSGIYINGQCQVVEGNVPVFNLEGASIVARETGIYAAGYAAWNIKDTTIESANALSLKSGSFIIDGGLYKSTGEFFEPSEDTSNGSVDTGAALSMTSNDDYAKKLDVVVNSGKFESLNGYSVYEGIPNKKDSSIPVAIESYVTLRINGGEFVGNTGKGSIKLNSIKNPKVIYGGSFNVTPDASYYAEGYLSE